MAPLKPTTKSAGTKDPTNINSGTDSKTNEHHVCTGRVIKTATTVAEAKNSAGDGAGPSAPKTSMSANVRPGRPAGSKRGTRRRVNGNAPPACAHCKKAKVKCVRQAAFEKCVRAGVADQCNAAVRILTNDGKGNKKRACGRCSRYKSACLFAIECERCVEKNLDCVQPSAADDDETAVESPTKNKAPRAPASARKTKTFKTPVIVISDDEDEEDVKDTPKSSAKEAKTEEEEDAGVV